MSIRTLLVVILKILGLLFLRDLLKLVPDCYNIILIAQQGFDKVQLVSAASYIVVLAAVYFVVMYVFLFRSEWLIGKLKLDTGFEERTLALQVHRSTVLSIAIMVVGLWLIADALPLFLRHLYYYLAERQNRLSDTATQTLGWVLIYGIKILVGFLFLGNQRDLVNLIGKKRRRTGLDNA